MEELRGAIGELAKERQTARQRLLAALAWLILLAAVALAAYEHWPKEEESHTSGDLSWIQTDPTGLVQVGLLLLALALLIRSGMSYWTYRKQDAESERFDWRALAEGLRVQYFWNLAGVRASVGAEYLHRHRSELSWIRYAIMSASLPYERWRDRFAGLGRSDQRRLLHAAWVSWVRGQRWYAHGKSVKEANRGHTWHRRGWTLAAAGVVNVAGMLVTEVSPRLGGFFGEHGHWIGLGTMLSGLVLLGIHAWRSHRAHCGACEYGEEGHDACRSYLAWVFDRPLLWGHALVIGGAVLVLVHRLAHVQLPWPDHHGWWIILTGGLLLSGAMSLAWTERSFHSETARSNRSLEYLFSCADSRLERLIEDYENLPPGPASKRRLEEIRSILYELGREALSENAEWLILHRARPLEPFMAG